MHKLGVLVVYKLRIHREEQGSLSTYNMLAGSMAEYKTGFHPRLVRGLYNGFVHYQNRVITSLTELFSPLSTALITITTKHIHIIGEPL